jgi:hypothetical protein
MIRMTNGFSLDSGAVLALVSPASSAVLAAEDASVAAAAAGVEDAEDVAAAADADAAVVNQLLAFCFQDHCTNPCMSQCRGLSLYIWDKLRFIR